MRESNRRSAGNRGEILFRAGAAADHALAALDCRDRGNVRDRQERSGARHCRFVAAGPGAIVIRTDVIRKELFGVDPLTPLPKEAYQADITERVYRTMFERRRQIATQGFSAILDAAFLREAERDALDRQARNWPATFRPIFLTADLAIRLSRIASRRGDASDATRDVAAQQEHCGLGQLSWPMIDASGSTDETLQRSAAHLLGNLACPDTSLRKDTE